jgi:hypothetical protein
MSKLLNYFNRYDESKQGLFREPSNKKIAKPLENSVT